MTPSGLLPTATAAALLLSSTSPPLGGLAFAPTPIRCRPPLRSSHQSITALSAAKKKGGSSSSYPPSTVIDPDGPTPAVDPDPFPEVDIESLSEYHYDESNHPVPHQPWRRGDTDGCHDPISAPWRVEAERIIDDAVHLVGARVVDVTWYMAKCVISLDEKSFSNVVNYVDGPEVRIAYPDASDVSGHTYDDPEAGTEDEMLTEEDELLDYEQYDEETEYEILKANMPREYDEETGEELPPRDPRGREERAMEMREEWESRWVDDSTDEKPFDDGMFAHPVDTKALSVVSQAITRALSEDDVEARLRILTRHDIILTSPLDNPVVLDSQTEFDAAAGLDVYVETRDPWGSNRVLGGKLVDRNALDVIINQDNSGRMVTVPISMIHQVLLPSGLAKGSARVKAGMMGDDDEGDEDGDGEEYYGEGEEGAAGGYLQDVEEEEVFE